MAEVLFDLSAEYAHMLNQGLRLSGESRDYFIEGRLSSLVRRLNPKHDAGCPSARMNIRRIEKVLDFGCGTGSAAPYLRSYLGCPEIVGVDSSENALAHARSHILTPSTSFEPLHSLASLKGFDLCYVNGVFHHIEPAQRKNAVANIRETLRPGGLLALFENNPWNPGTRMVMRRIPFDRDAIPLPIPETRGLLENNGFEVEDCWTLFYFPRALSALRFLESSLESFPLGAQYCVLGRKAG